ncbi:hypothetical protein A1D23_11080 [Chelonobacter oris]|uniref:AraC family transcriptional regulator n=1 Tax=Chelonobacter oris TaxID=505317 RepID=UPI002449D6D8|nr:AraC family transcriptional regulator [Chelonobacter oris]MDH3000997.1 hypothetical protein [Chelonobacter oris]
MHAPDKFPLNHNLLIQISSMGMDIVQLMKAAGISPTVLSDSRPTLPTAHYFAFWQAVAQQSGDPLLGLKIDGGDNQAGCDPATIVMMHSCHFLAALKRLARYKKMVCPQRICIDRRAEETAVSSQWPFSEQPEPDIISDMFFRSIQHTLVLSLNPTPAPLRIELTRNRIPPGYQAYFGCPIITQAERNAIVYANRTLELPLNNHNAELLHLFQPLLAQNSGAPYPQSLQQQVQQEIARLLNGNKPTLEQIAARLFITPRTLQRRLKAENLSFGRLLEATRAQTAEQLLQRQDMGIGEIAFYLGYQETHSFSRAFHQWHGISPLQWRKQHGLA